MYRCEHSTKCISKHRLVDGIRDCPFDDDETFSHSCSLSDVHHRFTCSIAGDKKCFSPITIEDEKNNCEKGEDEIISKGWIHNGNTFQMICDGRPTELLPVLIDEQNETDETECEHWPCNNTYSRCDGFWLCKDGADDFVFSFFTIILFVFNS
ncbi:unnamed protein product, partial [Rotaria sp. Silwood1]